MEPILLHGPLAVPILQEQYGVIDADVLGAVAYHTTAHAGMTPLQKLLFIADKIEPEKRARAEEIDRVAVLAVRDLDGALLAYLEYHIAYAIGTGWPLHPNTIAARNELLARRRPPREDRPLIAGDAEPTRRHRPDAAARLPVRGVRFALRSPSRSGKGPGVRSPETPPTTPDGARPPSPARSRGRGRA